MRRPPWLILIILAFGLLLAYGGYSTYADQKSGSPGRAKISECTGGGKYQPGIHCRGTWNTGGSLLDGGHVNVGDVNGAGYGDVGKTIEVRIHGSDHATKPSLGTPMMLWALSALVLLLALFILRAWWRSPATPAAAA
jgi:hypothetical protein